MHTSSTGAKYVYGRLYGHTRIDEGAYSYVPLPRSVDATKIYCGYSHYSTRHNYLLGQSREVLFRDKAARLKKARDRRAALLLGIVHDAARDASKKVTAACAKKARARRVALLLDVAHDAACDAWKKVLTDRRLSTLKTNSMARQIQG